MTRTAEAEVGKVLVGTAASAAASAEIGKSLLGPPTRKFNYKVRDIEEAKFTLDLAEHMINMTPHSCERPLKMQNVENLMGHAWNGEFLGEQANLSDCLCKWDHVIRRVNGHHCCWMRHYLDKDWPLIVKIQPRIATVRVIHYEADTEDDYRGLYAQMDRGAARSLGHVTMSRLFDTEEFMGLSRKTLKDLKNGYAYWRWGDKPAERKKQRIDDVLLSMQKGEFYILCREVGQFINDLSMAESKFISREAVIGAMFASFSKVKGASVEFWTTVRNGLDISNAQDPRKILKDYLQGIRVSASNKFAKKGTTATPEFIHRVCLKCWNAWREGDSLPHVPIIRTNGNGAPTGPRPGAK